MCEYATWPAMVWRPASKRYWRLVSKPKCFREQAPSRCWVRDWKMVSEPPYSILGRRFPNLKLCGSPVQYFVETNFQNCSNLETWIHEILHAGSTKFDEIWNWCSKNTTRRFPKRDVIGILCPTELRCRFTFHLSTLGFYQSVMGHGDDQRCWIGTMVL